MNWNEEQERIISKAASEMVSAMDNGYSQVVELLRANAALAAELVILKEELQNVKAEFQRREDERASLDDYR